MACRQKCSFLFAEAAAATIPATNSPKQAQLTKLPDSRRNFARLLEVPWVWYRAGSVVWQRIGGIFTQI